MLPLTIAGREPDPEWLDRVIAAVGLDDRRTHRPAELSGGQQQRVAVARALVSKPAVVFADEPTGNLDSTASDEVLALLRQAVDEFGQTVVMVTHERHAADHADRLITLGDGKVEYDGPATDGGLSLMLAYTLRGLAAHRLRSAGMALAVFLGVALVSGTFILTDTINRSFDDIFDQALEGADVVVTPKELVRQEMEEPPPFDARVLDRVREVPGVETAAGSVNALVRLVDDDNEDLGNGFAPNFVFSVVPEPFVPVTYTEGRAPRTARETAIDQSTADRKRPGASATASAWRATPSVRRYRIVGINRLGDASTGGSASATLILPEAQRVTDRRGKFDQISVAAAPGRDPGSSSSGASSACCRAPCARRPAARTPAARATRSQSDLQLLHDRAAGAVGRDRGGGRVPHLQHVLDHGRPAHPRVRAAAHARRQARRRSWARWWGRRR